MEEKKKVRITINVDSEVIEHFKAMSEKSGIPYQTLINYYLVDSVKNNREILVKFE